MKPSPESPKKLEAETPVSGGNSTESHQQQSSSCDFSLMSLQGEAVLLDSPEVSPNVFEKIEQICLSFTGEWEDKKPSIGDYLQQVARDDQPTLLCNLLEYEIRKRREKGETPAAQDYISQFPQYERLIRRIFLDSSSVSQASRFDLRLEERDSIAPAASRLGDYRLVRKIGKGGMGIVYEAIHLAKGYRVALKTLPAVSGDSLHRFKREFRVLADVTHPNLVGLRTLENDGGQWFITLDLIEGTDFLSRVRPGGLLDEQRLRQALSQLVTGLMALHNRGVLHRDLKPGNVMVTHEGRLVILDFGLIAEWGNAGKASAMGFGGTPAYMAPEQAAGDEIGPAADWYAAGVMLYEALCGSRPFFAGGARQVMASKQQIDAPLLPVDNRMPSDLADLAMRLLIRDPAKRPDPLMLAGAVASTAHVTGETLSTTGNLIGRETQFAALAEILKTFRETRAPVTAFIRGRSGEGKTSLAERFLTPLRNDGSLVVMSGRCYDRESVPFKALDTLVDALTSHLRSLSDTEAALLLPDDIGILSEVFPVLRRCEIVAKAPRAKTDAIDQQQIRQRSFAALRLLLDRISQSRLVVWFADDLQWGDIDSARALFEVMRPPGAPGMFFLGSYRSDEVDTSPFLNEWQDLQKEQSVDFGNSMISVGPLSIEESTQLVVNLLERDDEIVRRRAVQFHAQTGGNPFLLTELAGCFDPETDAFHTTDIHGILARKIEQLPPEAGPLLQSVAVSGQAVDLKEAAEVAGIMESPDAMLTRMRNLRLLRIIGTKVDTYHDRIRYAIVQKLAPESLREFHEKYGEVISNENGGLSSDEISELIETGGLVSPKQPNSRIYDLSYHYDAAGNKRMALAYSLIAAKQAKDQFALDVSAQQMSVARKNLDFPSTLLTHRIAQNRGECLLKIGQYEEASEELSIAFEQSDKAYDRAEVLGLQGELQYKMGKVGQSIKLTEEALRGLGIRVPRTIVGFTWRTFAETVIQLSRTMTPWRLHKKSPNASTDLANRLLARLEYGYYCNNVIKLLWGSLIGLNKAQLLPPSPSLSFNYVVHANDMAVLGWHSRAAKYYTMARELSVRLNDEWGAALSVNHFALGCCAAGRYEDGIRKAAPGMLVFAKLGDQFETNLAYMLTAICQYGLGDLRESLIISKRLFESSVRSGDAWFCFFSIYMWAKCSRGNLPFDELSQFATLDSENILFNSVFFMGEGYWHLKHGRNAEAIQRFEKSWMIAKCNFCVTTFNPNVLNELITALRINSETNNSNKVSECKDEQKRIMKLCKWSVRLARLMPTEQAHSIRELAMAHAHLGRTKKAWKLAKKSYDAAAKLKARYEMAKSQLLLGELGVKLSKPEAPKLIQEAKAIIHEIESAVDKEIARMNDRPTA